MAFPHDSLLYPVSQSDYSNEWLDLDNSFDFPSDYINSVPTMDSILLEDNSLSLSGTDEFNWNSCSDSTSQAYQPSLDQVFEDGYDNGNGEVTGDGDFFFDSPTTSFNAGLYESPASNGLSYDASDFLSSIRHMVEAKASSDTRYMARKEKRREAAIAIHLQRLQDAVAADRYLSSDSCTSISSPCWSDFVRESMSPQPPPTKSTKVSSASSESVHNASQTETPYSSGADPIAGGVEMVLDLNMNAATNLPKKQKPRSLAQKESYMKVRKHGACEKHRKQHKRCNCFEKNTAGLGSVSTIPPATTPLSRPMAVKSIKDASQRAAIREPSERWRSPANLLQVIHTVDKEPSNIYSSPAADANYPKHSSRAGDGSGIRGNAALFRPLPDERLQVRQPWMSAGHSLSTPFIFTAHASYSAQESPGMSPKNRSSTPVMASYTAPCCLSAARDIQNSSAASSPFFSTGSGTIQQPIRFRLRSMVHDASANAPGAVRTVKSTVVSGPLAVNGALIEYGYGVTRQVVEHIKVSIFSYWRSWSVVTSLAGSFFGNATRACCRQILFAKRFSGSFV